MRKFVGWTLALAVPVVVRVLIALIFRAKRAAPEAAPETAAPDPAAPDPAAPDPAAPDPAAPDPAAPDPAAPDPAAPDPAAPDPAAPETKEDRRPSLFPWIFLLILAAFFMGGGLASLWADEAWSAQLAMGGAMVAFAFSVGTSNVFKTKAEPFGPWYQIVFSVLATPFLIGLSVGAAEPAPVHELIQGVRGWLLDRALELAIELVAGSQGVAYR